MPDTLQVFSDHSPPFPTLLCTPEGWPYGLHLGHPCPLPPSWIWPFGSTCRSSKDCRKMNMGFVSPNPPKAVCIFQRPHSQMVSGFWSPTLFSLPPLLLVVPLSHLTHLETVSRWILLNDPTHFLPGSCLHTDSVSILNLTEDLFPLA